MCPHILITELLKKSKTTNYNTIYNQKQNREFVKETDNQTLEQKTC